MQYRKVVPFFSYAVDDFGDELFIGYHPLTKEVEVACCGALLDLFVNEQRVPLGQWVSLCVTLDLVKKQVLLYYPVNDTMEQVVMQDDRAEPDRVRGGGLLMVGQRQSVVGGGFSTALSLCGQVADLHLFDTVLTEDELLSFLTCQAAEGLDTAPIVSFASLQDTFTMGEAEVDSLQVQDACHNITFEVVIISHPITFKDAHRLCDLMSNADKHPVFTPVSMDEQNDLLADMEPYEESCLSRHTSLGDMWLDGRSV
ncbi:uncharacterized protein LOC123515725 [Portunus trituberculatus]|uniref:uncharacterized protein LOC123515725 n=1 Tax=Portunus trituberculatus TaxID=210409 RepID=UPI001E1D0E25|nr:uncharacterized protein LOC123515725 [Portunus trituberculatus]